MLARVVTIAVIAGWLSGPTMASGNSYVEMRLAALKRCEAINLSEYQSGLIFNPEGYRSYYVRSACFQDAAVKFRDVSVCAHVTERRSLFSSSWGYSSKRCRQLVAEGARADRKALEETKSHYSRGAVRLRDFRVERNGNGRDFDIIPSFDTGYAHAYTLRFEIIDALAIKGGALLDSSGFHLDGNDKIRIFVRQTDIRKRFPRFELERPYRVRGSLILNVGSGGQGAMWSDAFIERIFPVAERSKFLVREVVF